MRDESGYQTRRSVQSVDAAKVGKSLTMAFVSSSLSECVCESSGVRDLGGLKSARRSLIKLGRLALIAKALVITGGRCARSKPIPQQAPVGCRHRSRTPRAGAGGAPSPATT